MGRRILLTPAGPLVVGLASQALMNLVDIAMVGRLGPAAQASAGLGSLGFWVLAALLMGLGVAVHAMVAQRAEEGERAEAGAVLDSGLFLAVVLGLSLGYLLGASSPRMFGALSNDPDVIEGGALYLQLRLMGLGVVVANACFRGFYNGIGKPSAYLAGIAVTHIANIVFNWIFIFGHLGTAPMGVRGAGMASALAAVVGSVVYTGLTASNRDLMKTYEPFRFASLAPARVRRMVSLAAPDAAWGILMMASFLVFLRLHDMVGTRETAAGSILVQLAAASLLPSIAVGLGGALALGRSRGEGRPDDGRRRVHARVRRTAVALLLPCAVLLFFPDLVVGLFTPDGRVVQLARPAARILALTMVFDALPIVVLLSLQAGAPRFVAVVQLFAQYAVLLPIAWFLGVSLELGLLGLWLALPASRIFLAIPAVLKLRSDSWTRVEV